MFVFVLGLIYSRDGGPWTTPSGSPIDKLRIGLTHTKDSHVLGPEKKDRRGSACMPGTPMKPLRGPSPVPSCRSAFPAPLGGVTSSVKPPHPGKYDGAGGGEVRAPIPRLRLP